MSRSGLRSPRSDDYGMLAWLLRSRPRFLREKTIIQWVFRHLLPEDEPDDVDAVLASASEVARTLCNSFNENDAQWQGFNYFEYANAVTQ